MPTCAELSEAEVKMQEAFYYPELIKECRIMDEDLEEAIIAYLVKGGLDETTLRLCQFTLDTSKPRLIPTLTIKWELMKGGE